MAPTNPDTAQAAFELGNKLNDAAIEAFETMLQNAAKSRPFSMDPQATMREKFLIRVFSMQIASAIAQALEEAGE